MTLTSMPAATRMLLPSLRQAASRAKTTHIPVNMDLDGHMSKRRQLLN